MGGIQVSELINAFPHCAIIADAKGRMVFISDALARYSGKSIDALMRGEWLEIIHPEDQKAIARSWTRGTEKLESYEAEHRMRREDGEYRWFIASAKAIRRDGTIQYWVATLLDIHDRKIAETALRQSQEDLEFVLRSGSLGTWRLDLRTMEMECSAQCKMNYGRDPTEPFSYAELWACVIQQDAEPTQAKVMAAIVEHGEYDATYGIRWPDGSSHWVNVRGRPFYDAGAKPTHMTGISIDVTKARLQEQALAMTRDTLLVAEQSAAMGVWEWNVKTNERWHSDGELRIYGFAINEENRHQAVLATRLHVADRPMVEVLIQRALKTGSFQSDHRILLPNETDVALKMRWIHSRARVLYDESGEPLRMIGVDLDITDRKRGEESLRSAQADVQAASDAKDRFLAMLSHELRTPLNPALLAISSILRADELTPGVRDELEMARRNIELETHLIDDLLEVTRIIQGKMHIRREPLRLHELLRHAVDICESQMSKRIQLEWHLDVVDDRIVGDPARLQQVFWNILKNAYKFSDESGTVTIRTTAIEPATIRVEIIDTGIGISKDGVKRIFTPFAQGSATISKVFGGLGLGLAIAKGVVDLHQGKMHAESEGLGRGTKLTVELPTTLVPQITAETSAPSTAGEASDDAAAVSSSVRTRRVLLVEDHADTARTMTRVLKILKYDVETVGTVKLALDHAGGEFDIVISDLGLPDGHGRDLIRALRSRYPLRPVIALSGYAMAEDVQLSLAAGAAAHLAKPINIDTLKQTLERILA